MNDFAKYNKNFAQSQVIGCCMFLRFIILGPVSESLELISSGVKTHGVIFLHWSQINSTGEKITPVELFYYENNSSGNRLELAINSSFDEHNMQEKYWCIIKIFIYHNYHEKYSAIIDNLMHSGSRSKEKKRNIQAFCIYFKII